VGVRVGALVEVTVGEAVGADGEGVLLAVPLAVGGEDGENVGVAGIAGV
jgi:hypothetical protein